MSSQGLVIAIDLGIFWSLAIQTSGIHFVENDAWQFGALADDGRVTRNLLQISEHLGNGIDHLGAGSRRLVRNGSYAYISNK